MDTQRIYELQELLNAELAKHQAADEDRICQLADEIEQAIWDERYLKRRVNTLLAS